MRKTYKYKLYPSKRNRKLHNQIGAAGMVYNHCIALHKRYYRLYHKMLNKYKLQKHLTKLKRNKKRYWYFSRIGAQAVQDITDRIDRAYTLFFHNKKKKIKASPPKFKKVRKYKSFTLKQAGWRMDEETGTLLVGKQKYRYFNSRKTEGKKCTLTIRRDSLYDLYIYVVCEVEEPKVEPRSGKSVGFDFGLKGMMLVGEDATDDVKAPSFFKAQEKAYKKACRHFSLSKKNSHRHWAWARIRDRIFRKQVNRRRDYHYKLAHFLCRKYAVISLESLNMKWMQRGHGKKVNDYGFSEFVNILSYVGRKYGTRVVKVDKFFPSTQLCSACGFKDPFVADLKVREWECPCCQAHHDRDRNAAKNIRLEGLKQLVQA